MFDLPKPEIARVRIWTLVAATVALLTMLTPELALASGGQQPSGSNGVHVDPGSPTGKQYVLPIQAARSEGGGSGGGGSSASPHLFGAGVSASQTGTTPSSTKSTPHGGGKAKAASPHPVPAPRLPVTEAGSSGSVAGKEAASTSGGDAWLPLIAGGAAVLILGGGGGLALRRRLVSS